MKNDAEVLIIGGGIAGSTLSRLLAEKGYEVLLVDCLPKEKIGLKVCGNAVPRKYFDWAGIPRPKKGEFDSRVAGSKIYSPDSKTVFADSDEGYIVDRYRFGQRLLKESLDAGTRLVDRTLAVSPLVKNNRVLGARVKNVGRSGTESFFGRITIDATGFVSRLRRLLPSDWWVAEHVAREESYSCYREILSLKDDLEDPEHCHVFISNRIAPLGYYWIFPQGPGKANVGVGVSTGLGRNPRDIFHRHIASLPVLKGSKTVDRGAGLVYCRRPLGSMLWNGFACIGDAGYQLDPLGGAGIGPSIQAAKILSEVFSEAEADDCTVNSLWPYNYRYMKACGARFSAVYVFSQLMGCFSDEEINYTMASGLVSEKSMQSFRDSVDAMWAEKIPVRFLLRGLVSRFSLLRRLKLLNDLVKEVFALYSSYPSDPIGYPDWKKLDIAFSRRLKSVCHHFQGYLA